MNRGQLKSLLQRLETIFPIICIGVYIEGSYQTIGIIALIIYITYKVYVGVRALDRTGMIDILSNNMRRKKK